MQIMTKDHKVVEVTNDKIYTFNEGIIGFEEYKTWALVACDIEPFVWLQSTQKEDLAFLLVDPFLVSSDYEVDINDETLKLIGTKEPRDIIIMTIVTITGDNITANFLGPIVINKCNRLCAQAILSDDKWTTKFDIMKSLAKKKIASENNDAKVLATVGGRNANII